MIVWGGTTVGLFLDDGAIYDPATDQWSPMSRQAAPSGRSGHSAVWTGSEMLIIGGVDLDGELAGGSAYDPETDTWRNLTTAGAPAKRQDATAAWNGLQFIIFGGRAEGLPVAALQRLNPEPPVFLYRKP